MSSISDINQGFNRKSVLIIAVPIAALVLIFLLWMALGQAGNSQLKPLLPEPTAIQTDDISSAVQVSFSELNDDPLAFLNKSIIVSGNFYPVDRENCLKYTGPDIRWSLTAENLQLDILGFERLIGLIPVNTPMTAQGIWRLYQGPLGCGKGPPEGTAWYLEIKKIIQPNPLVGKTGQGIPIIIDGGGQGLPILTPTLPVEEVLPTVTDIFTPTLQATDEILLPTIEGEPSITPTEAFESTVTPTPPIQQTFTPAPTNTPVPGATATAVTPTITPTSNVGNPTATTTTEPPPGLPTSTEVPDGYPGPGQTTTPTPTVNPYP